MLEMIRRRKKDEEIMKKMIKEIFEINKGQKEAIKQLEALNRELKKLGRGK